MRPRSHYESNFRDKSPRAFSSNAVKPQGISEISGEWYKSTSSQGRVKPQPMTSNNENGQSAFNPRQLLNPRGFHNAQAKKKMNSTPNAHPPQDDSVLESSPSPSPQEGSGTSTNSKRSFDDFNDGDGGSGGGLGNLMDKLHNVEERQNIVQKRAKGDIDREDEESKKMTDSGRRTGNLGEYLREERKKGDKEEAKKQTTSIVDLTAEDDDDEIRIVAENNVGQQEVCYGRIIAATVAAHKVPRPLSKASLAQESWPAMRVEFRRVADRTSVVNVLDPSGTHFGNLDNKSANALTPLMDSTPLKLRTQPRLYARNKGPNDWPGQPCSAALGLMINLYGPRKYAPQIGKHLGQHNVWLQTPAIVDAGIHTLNPHANRAPAKSHLHNVTQSNNHDYEVQSVEETEAVISKMFDSMNADKIPEMEPDSTITTPMLRHQKQALHFMTQKEKPITFDDENDETNTLWRVKYKPNGQKNYYHIVTGDQTSEQPPQVFGGILADMMGLGKTLSILSLIVSSLSQTEEWVSQPRAMTGPDAGLRRCKTTLLVSPLTAMMNWEEQIKSHIQPGALSYYVYHGPSRTNDVDELLQYDIVITTYNIVLSDLEGKRRKNGRSPLSQLNFFRIVLDEAHIIREQSTGQSQAVCMLPAQRRWAVTGTPVQNRLDDFGALTKFLRLKPLDDRAAFSRAILAPFKMLDHAVIEKLRILVGSITLRRLKDKINLPKRFDQVVKLRFTEEEQAMHDYFKKDSDMRVKVITNKTGKVGGMYHHILMALLRLRLICAHGKELLNEEDQKRLQGLSRDDAIDLDDDDLKVTPKSAYEIYKLKQNHSMHECAQCGENLGQDTKEDTIGYMLSCYCLICKDCFVSKNAIGKIIDSDSNDNVRCQYCEAQTAATSYIITQRGLEGYEKAHNEVSRNSRQTKSITHYSGPATKTKALVSQLKESLQESSLLEAGAPPIKSVVFSGWTSHLNLIQIALEDAQIPYTRLDGSMSRAARTLALDSFSNDPNVLVLLVTIGAGGVGLNLTAASKVYVMEPQFNPAAEAQAIDRIHRLGQKREVTTTRFIMEGSIEEKIQELQRKKQSLADLSMSMDRGKGLGKKETALQKLQELRSLFK